MQHFKVRFHWYAWTLVNIKRRALTWKSRYLRISCAVPSFVLNIFFQAASARLGFIKSSNTLPCQFLLRIREKLRLVGLSFLSYWKLGYKPTRWCSFTKIVDTRVHIYILQTAHLWVRKLYELSTHILWGEKQISIIEREEINEKSLVFLTSF